MKKNANSNLETRTQKIIAIDPSGTGTTGIYFLDKEKNQEIFQEYKSSKWEEHLQFLVERVKVWKPNIIIYENTYYVHKRIPGTLSLLKLIGGIVGIKYTFDFIEELSSIAVNQVKSFKDKVFANKEQIEKLTCKIGRGKGWKYKSKRINLHQLDALVTYHLWSGESLESTKNIKKKITELKRKKKLGIKQKRKLEQLQKNLAERTK
jgi:hypothetical protein